MKLADAAARYVRRFVDQLQLHICGVRGSKIKTLQKHFTTRLEGGSFFLPSSKGVCNPHSHGGTVYVWWVQTQVFFPCSQALMYAKEAWLPTWKRPQLSIDWVKVWAARDA